MTVQDLLGASRSVVDEAGNRTAVVADIAEWRRLPAWIETVVDQQAAEAALVELDSAEGAPDQAGWLDWGSARAEWTPDDEPSH
jgi:hypothetical protein